ncbi:MAG: IS110 family transposase [Spirochaeta sp.]|jgi:transposase|nr:IS110 family transposase [Spirochaeta sp.]
MKQNTFVGVDPASGDFECAFIRNGERETSHRTFTIKVTELDQMIEWIRDEKIDVVAIEGSGGYTRPLERALRTAEIPFYSIDPYRITRYRQAVLGQHKNNQKDAVAVAYFAREQAAQGNLEIHRRTWFPDETLRPLVRLYEQKQKEATREINRLWQRIQNVSGDMFLTLRGLSGGTRKSRCVSQQWLLKLFAWYPDLTTWQSFTREGIAEVIDEHRTNIIDKIMVLKDVAADVQPYSTVAQVELKVSASTALALKQAVRLLYHQIEAEVERNAFTSRLMEYGGIGAITAAQIVSEIADISRFPNDDHLASYAGLGRREHKTGIGTTERSTFMFNHRLKNTFFTAARNYTLYNPDSHLTGYYRSLKARGMKQTELYKRVARALVRRFYRDLKAVAAQETETRHEGNPEPEPAGNDSLKQPHTSPYEKKYTPVRARKSKRISSAAHPRKKEVITADFP